MNNKIKTLLAFVLSNLCIVFLAAGIIVHLYSVIRFNKIKTDNICFFMVSVLLILTLKVLQNKNYFSAFEEKIYLVSQFGIVKIKLLLFEGVLLIVWITTITYSIGKIGGDLKYSWFNAVLCCIAFILFYSFCAISNRFFQLLGQFLLMISALFSATLLLLGHYFNNDFRPAISAEDVYAALQTLLPEALVFAQTSLISPQIIFLMILFFIFTIIVFIIHFRLIQGIFLPKKMWINLGIVLSSILFVLLGQSFKFTKVIVAAYSEYYLEIELVKQMNDQMINTEVIKASKKEQGELYVMIIGESESRSHMFSSGPFANIPWQSKLKPEQGWVVFENAYSNHTHTSPSVTTMFSNGRYITGLTFPHGANLTRLSKAANIRTTWISNQLTLGAWDSPVAAIANTFDQTVFMTEGGRYAYRKVEPDEVLLPTLDKALQNMDKNQNNLLVIHLMGNHSPFKKRYPDSFTPLNINHEKYLGKANKKVGSAYNEYLTSIKYTDSILNRIAERISAQQQPTALIYFSDHGEHFSEKMRYGHNIKLFDWPMSRIPFLVWLSDDYREKYPQKLNNLLHNQRNIFTNDLVFDLYHGLANIESNEYKPEFDISSDQYNVSLDNAKAAYGLIRNDPVFYAPQKISQFESSGLSVAVQDVDTLMKFYELKKLGVHSLHLTAYEDQSELIVGWDRALSSHMTVKEYLQHVNNQANFIWVTVDHLNLNNVERVLSYLTTMDKLYSIKKKVLIESRNIDALAVLAGAGWQTSFRIDENKLLVPYLDKNIPLVEQICMQIAQDIYKNNIQSVSYDDKIHKIIQQLLPDNPDQKIKRYVYSSKTVLNNVTSFTRIEQFRGINGIAVYYDTYFTLK